ncbi:MAG: hypothetical protein KAT43_04190 [Nanoarchaeota archaeon]|nr:hypothetical protein [Nanoarchaeota archaeon]
MTEKILTVIPENQLILDRFYLGRGRNTNIALFEGDEEWEDAVGCFITLCYKFEYPMHKYEPYLGDNNEGGCFQPYLLLPTMENILAAHPDPKIIPKEEMEEFRFYFGLGDGVYIAQWGSHDEFLTWGKRMISSFAHWTREGPEYMGKLAEATTAVPKKYGTEFRPFKLIDEGEMIDSFGKGAWERHYGKKIRLSSPD